MFTELKYGRELANQRAQESAESAAKRAQESERLSKVAMQAIQDPTVVAILTDPPKSTVIKSSTPATPVSKAMEDKTAFQTASRTSGNVVVMDYEDGTVMEGDPESGYITTYEGSGVFDGGHEAAIGDIKRVEIAQLNHELSELKTKDNSNLLDAKVYTATGAVLEQIKTGAITTEDQFQQALNQASNGFSAEDKEDIKVICRSAFNAKIQNGDNDAFNQLLASNQSSLEQATKGLSSEDQARVKEIESRLAELEDSEGGVHSVLEDGPPYMKMIKDSDPDEIKAHCAEVSDTYKDGFVGCGNGGYWKYLTESGLYTDPKGLAFVKSDNVSDKLKSIDPKEQQFLVENTANILNDESLSYSIDPSNPKYKNATDKVLIMKKDGVETKQGIEYHKLSPEQKKAVDQLQEKNLVLDAYPSEQNKPDQANNENVKPPEEAKEDPQSYLPPDNYNKKQFMQIANHDKVPYVRVNGYNKIRFPNVWSGRYAIELMGLPPTRVQRDKEVPAISKNAFDLVAVDAEELVPGMYIYDEDEQLKKSFLKLTIHPIDIESIYGMNGERLTEDQVNKNKKKYLNKSAVLTEIEYNFAVQANSQITYSHQNNYAPSGIEGMVGGMFGSIADTINQTSSLSQVSGGAAGNLFNSAAALGNKLASAGQQMATQTLNTLAGSIRQDWDQASKDTASMFLGAFKNLGDVALSRLSGGRIDLPDVWTDSQTNVQHSFTLEFRTMNPDPLSDQYFKDIILPVYILLTLSLPTDTKGIVYKTPPYISCNLDQLFEIRIGAITSISIDPHLEEVNFKRAPRHVTVQITIKDLYSVMKQKAYDADNDDKGIGDENEDTVTKDKFINNFVKYAESLDKNKTPVTNEAYYLTEFARIPAYMMALENYKKEQAAKNLSKLNLASVNASTANKAPNNPVSSDTAKLAQSLANNVTKSAKILKDAKGKTNFITSIGNAITGVTKGVKNIMAGVQSAIQPVRNLINTGKMVMNSVNGLKNSVKLIGQTANLEGILNGQFASSVGFAFSNVANATGVVEAISDACAGGGSFKTIMKNLGQVPERVLTNNLANAVTDSGSLNLSNQIRNAACTWYGLANMFGQTYPNVVGLKDLTSRGSDITSIATVLFDNLGGIANGLNSFTTGQSVGSTSGNTTQVDPLLSQYVSSTLKGATAKGVITAGEASSNQKVQSELAEATQVAKEQLTSTPDVVVKLEGAYEEAIKEAKKAYGEGNKARAAAFMQAVSDQIPPEELKTTVDQLEKKFETYLATAKNNEKEARQLALTEILEKC